MVISGLWSRVTGGDSSSQLEQDLKRLTNSEVIDVPKDLLLAISQSSYNADDRQTIMQHLRECLAEPNNKRWRRIYAGLVLVETLLDKGCPQLVQESAEGVHFDLVQRLSFLEKFDFNSDMRVQKMVTGKATALRALLIQKQQSCDSSITGTTCAPSSPSNGAAFGTSSAHTPSSNGGFSAVGGCPVTSYSSDGPRPVEEPKKGRTVVNGIVSVGHRDDTTSESEGEQDRRRRQDKRGDEGRSRRKKSDRDRRRRSSSDTSSASSDDSGRRRRDSRASRSNGSAQAAPPPPPAPQANLLDF